ncbi:hypothetical protein VTK56DRAFT_3188 [Thermocarpiscus australiensis]
MCVREMVARASDDERVVFNYVNPGLRHSDLLREVPLSGRIVKFFLARSAEIGSRTLVVAASAGESSQGQYLSNGKVQDPPRFLETKGGAESQTRVWDELVEILEGLHPGISSVLQLGLPDLARNIGARATTPAGKGSVTVKVSGIQDLYGGAT